MSDPESTQGGDDRAARAITFVSHFRVKPGHAEAFRALSDSVSTALAADKPRTAIFLGYLAGDGSTLTFIHLCPDADAMSAHVVGANDRAAAAYEHIEPAGWEVYGRPHPADLDQLRAASEHAGVPLIWEPDALGGFLRPPR